MITFPSSANLAYLSGRERNSVNIRRASQKSVALVYLAAHAHVCTAIDVGNFLRAVNIATIFRSYVKAFITLVTEGTEAGVKAFRLISSTFKLAGGV